MSIDEYLYLPSQVFGFWAMTSEPSFSVFTAFCTRFCPHSGFKHVSSRMTSSFTAARQHRSIATAKAAEHRFIAATMGGHFTMTAEDILWHFWSSDIVDMSRFRVFIQPRFSTQRLERLGPTTSTCHPFGAERIWINPRDVLTLQSLKTAISGFPDWAE